MGIKIITIPFDKNKMDFKIDELENKLVNKKINYYKAELIEIENRYFWTIFIEYELVEGIKDIKLENKLSEIEEKIYVELREWRSEIAKKNGVPSYIIAKNEMLYSVIKKLPKNLHELKLIDGFGDKKIKEYGKDILNILDKYIEGGNYE